MNDRIDTRLPNDIGKGQLPNHAAIKTPWEKLISLYDANYFICRHRAGVASLYMEVLRILIPDYDERCTRMAECAEAYYDYLYHNVVVTPDGGTISDLMGAAMNAHPFMRGGMISGMQGDIGDESLLMAGRVTDFGSHRVEKELDTCPWDIMGSEICRTSPWAGSEVIGYAFRDWTKGGPKMRVTMCEARGCGDRHCRLVYESYDKYPLPTDATRKKWDNFESLCTQDMIKYTPEEKCIKDPMIYRAETGFRWRNGVEAEYDAEGMMGGAFYGYGMSAGSSLGVNYVSWVLEDMVRKGETTWDELDLLFENVFEGAGKVMFLDAWAVKGARDWMGVPPEICDGRVMGAYIEIYLQAIQCQYDIVAFNKDEVIYDIDLNRFNLTEFPHMRSAYIPLWYGSVKTLVGAEWSLWEEQAEDVPEGKFRIKIAKKIDKFAR